MKPRWTDQLAGWEARLSRPSAGAYLTFVVTASVVLALGVFAPKFQLWDLRGGEHFEVVRARSYLAQVEHPFRRDIEAAMFWRLLPPLVAHGLGLRGWSALAIPWSGIPVLLAACAWLLRREGLDRLTVFWTTALVATSSAVLVPLGWLGINDAWVWAGLAGVALGRGSASLLLLTLSVPWVDERFIIGLPLALTVRRELGGGRSAGIIPVVLGLLPYAALRIGLNSVVGGGVGAGFLRDAVGSSSSWLPYAPLGWWMAWRAGWLPLAAGLVAATNRWWIALVTFGTLGVMAMLAVDLSRSADIVLPLLLLGVIVAFRTDPTRTQRRLAGILLLNLLLPAVHVVQVKLDLISPLPLELFRLVRHWHGGSL